MRKDGRLFYRYGDEAAAGRHVERSPCPTTTRDGRWRKRTFTVYRTHHGPIVREADGKWISVRADAGAGQGARASRYLRTKARDYAAFRKVDGAAHQLVEQHDLRRRRRATSPTSTRNSSRSATTASTGRKPVDGSDPATEWHGVHAVDERPHVLNPANGWIYNTNNWP